MNTIGESAAQGAAGIILWGSLNDSMSKVSVAGGTAWPPAGPPLPRPHRAVTLPCHCRRCA